MKSKNKGLTVFVVIIFISVLTSIGLTVLSTAVNLHKTSIHKVQFVGRSHMLKSSLIYPKLMIEDYFKAAFFNATNSIKTKYQAYTEDELSAQLINIQKDYKRLVKDEMLFRNQMAIHIDINKIKLEQCIFRVTDFKAEGSESISITVKSSFDSRDYINSYSGIFKINLKKLSMEDVKYIMREDYDMLWQLHKEDLIEEKFYAS
mgnify:FL=1